MPIDLKSYFERIAYNGSTTVSVETLKGIHLAQVTSIPFENLSIQDVNNAQNAKDFISLREEDLFQKLVTEKRGGYCHENNELLAIALTQLGFTVERVAARVLTAPNLPITHKLLLVTIEEQQWVADVGFGGYGLLEPIPLVADQEVQQGGDRFRLIQNNQHYRLQIHLRESWSSLYDFTREPMQAIDFEAMSYYVSHHPESIFVKNRICVILKPEGRIIMNNFNLKMILQGKEISRKIHDGDDYRDNLKKYFGIVLPESMQLKKIAEENTPNPLTSWYGFFAKAMVGIASTVFIAKQIQRRLQ